ncbi:MAG: hypothetical protein HN969_16590 [Verrucomicrobia bacterium]|nr:hypothetical protein [Verrucomicrobiota bacterium]MBT7029170.1 hypothetical protein [Verrucomicrobiota bacterium]
MICKTNNHPAWPSRRVGAIYDIRKRLAKRVLVCSVCSVWGTVLRVQ